MADAIQQDICAQFSGIQLRFSTVVHTQRDRRDQSFFVGEEATKAGAIGIEIVHDARIAILPD